MNPTPLLQEFDCASDLTARLRGGVHAHLGAALLQEQQQAQRLGVGDVEVVAGEHPHPPRRTGIDHRRQVGHQQP